MLDIKNYGQVRYLLPFANAELNLLVTLMAQRVGLEDVCMELSIVDDAAMAEINRDNMGCGGPTNILSFPLVYDSFSPYTPPAPHSIDREVNREQPLGDNGYPEGQNQPFPVFSPTNFLLGALVVAPETVRREAFLYGQPLDEYTVFLLAHGFAHLLGYDHGPAMDTLVDNMHKGALAAVMGNMGAGPLPVRVFP